MKISKLHLTNFKGIEDLTIHFDEKTTIFFGVNGVGKSTVLRAIDLLYANIIWNITKTKKLANLEEGDIMFGKSKARIAAEFLFEGDIRMPYARSNSRSEGRKHNGEDLKSIVQYFRNSYIVEDYEDEEGNWIEVEDRKNMPIFVNYGVNRAVLEAKVASSKATFKKLNAFDKAIESKIDFKLLFEWFRNQEDIENQEKVRQDADYEDKALKAVKTAMLAMLEGVENIRIDRNPLAMKVCKEGKNLTVDLLSDGEKCTIALFGDLARRLTMANPSLENPLNGVGVVLIDEIELHMHPAWQRKVVGMLKKTFPNIQFIITTHSPQVLGELDGSNNLYVLDREKDTVNATRIDSLIGWDSNVILEELMKTSSVNQKITEQISELYALIAGRRYMEAERILDELDKLTSGRMSGLTRARMLITKGKRNEKN